MTIEVPVIKVTRNRNDFMGGCKFLSFCWDNILVDPDGLLFFSMTFVKKSKNLSMSLQLACHTIDSLNSESYHFWHFLCPTSLFESNVTVRRPELTHMYLKKLGWKQVAVSRLLFCCCSRVRYLRTELQVDMPVMWNNHLGGTSTWWSPFFFQSTFWHLPSVAAYLRPIPI